MLLGSCLGPFFSTRELRFTLHTTMTISTSRSSRTIIQGRCSLMSKCLWLLGLGEPLRMGRKPSPCALPSESVSTAGCSARWKSRDKDNLWSPLGSSWAAEVWIGVSSSGEAVVVGTSWSPTAVSVMLRARTNSSWISAAGETAVPSVRCNRRQKRRERELNAVLKMTLSQTTKQKGE